jgi:PAS domain S-box-containing protein
MSTKPTDATVAPRRDSTDSADDVEDPYGASVRFEDIFCLEDIQRIQDAFAEASGVASLITDPDGHPLTRPSNFTALCNDVIRQTEKGRRNCIRSDAHIGGIVHDGPTIRTCLSGGLLDGGTSIHFGKRHIANWLIGQVLDETADLEGMLAYAHCIGADEQAFREALGNVPRMSRGRFEKICQALYQFANHVSTLAMKNFEQSRLISDLRQAQERIKNRDRNLADIIDFLPDPTLVLDKEGTVLFWNRALEKLTGVAAVDMLGKSNFEYGAPFYGSPTPILADYVRGVTPLPALRYDVAHIGQGEIIAEATLPAMRGGPRHVWVKAVALYDDNGAITGAIEAIRDVTDRLQAETALRESEEKYRRIVETAYEGVWVFDADNKTTFVNRRMADMLGYAPEELLGKALDDFLPEEQMESAIYQKQRQGHSDVFERRIKRRDGGMRWVRISASPLYDASDEYIGALGMFTDISARKAIEEELTYQRQRLEVEVEERTRDLRVQTMELAEANIRLSELDRLKSAFLSTVSHELRTPLTSILGFAKLIGRDFSDLFLPLAKGRPVLEGKGRRIANNLSVVFNEAERLTRLINDVLDLNRIESGNMQWRDSRFNPLSILRKAAQGIEGLLEQHPEIAFVFDAPEALPDLFMDPDQLVQVVSNLLQNAVKFTKAGEVRMEVRRDGDALLICVRDSGIGIPANQLESIFDKFHQVGQGDTIKASAAKGTGLGLAICRQIVEHYNGRIWAESEIGQGSAFYVRLPLPDTSH